MPRTESVTNDDIWRMKDALCTVIKSQQLTKESIGIS